MAGHGEDWGLVCSVQSAQGLLSFTDVLLLEISPLCCHIVKNFSREPENVCIWSVDMCVCKMNQSEKKKKSVFSPKEGKKGEGRKKESQWAIFPTHPLDKSSSRSLRSRPSEPSFSNYTHVSSPPSARLALTDVIRQKMGSARTGLLFKKIYLFGCMWLSW